MTLTSPQLTGNVGTDAIRALTHVLQFLNDVPVLLRPPARVRFGVVKISSKLSIGYTK